MVEVMRSIRSEPPAGLRLREFGDAHAGPSAPHSGRGNLAIQARESQSGCFALQATAASREAVDIAGYMLSRPFFWCFRYPSYIVFVT